MSIKLLAARAVGQRRVLGVFDGPVEVTDIAGFSLTPLDAPAVTPSSMDALANGETVEVFFDTEMTPGLPYRLEVTGVSSIDPKHSSAVFEGFTPARPAGREFDLWSMLPAWNRREDVTGDLARLIGCFQEVTDLLLAELDRFPQIFDLERAPEDFLDLILRDLGNPFAFDLDELGKRRLAAVLVEMYRQKGTAVGIRNAIRFFLGIELVAVRSFGGTALVLGESELGVDWELGPTDQFARYAFEVEVDRKLTETERRHVRTIIGYMKPAHTHFVSLLEPALPEPTKWWVLGEFELGSGVLYQSCAD